MKVLIIIERSPKRRFLVNLHGKSLIKEIKNLINKRKHSQAIVTALAMGKFKNEIKERELPTLRADLILSETNANWDIT